MKKILIISGFIAVLLLILILTGWAVKDDVTKNALRQGNKQYTAAGYKNALKSYEKGLEANPENKPLNFNAAQAAYLLGEYEKAVEYYEKSEDCTEKFLNAGNIFFKAGESIEDDDEQKAQCYMQALLIYYDGIIKFPQDVALKYNYETVLEKLEIISEDQEQESDENGEDGEDGESQESDEQDGESEENQNQEQDSENDQDEEQQDYNEQDENENEPDLDQEAIERILQMLENQEEESLKNNQEIITGGDDKNGW